MFKRAKNLSTIQRFIDRRPEHLNCGILLNVTLFHSENEPKLHPSISMTLKNKAELKKKKKAR